jgi:hypothetical protein
MDVYTHTDKIIIIIIIIIKKHWKGCIMGNIKK